MWVRRVSVKIQVIFYSRYGHVYRLAEAIAAGAREVSGADVAPYQPLDLRLLCGSIWSIRATTSCLKTTTFPAGAQCYPILTLVLAHPAARVRFDGTSDRTSCAWRCGGLPPTQMFSPRRSRITCTRSQSTSWTTVSSESVRTLRCTFPMQVGVTDLIWDLDEMVRLAEDWEANQSRIPLVFFSLKAMVLTLINHPQVLNIGLLAAAVDRFRHLSYRDTRAKRRRCVDRGARPGDLHSPGFDRT